MSKSGATSYPVIIYGSVLTLCLIFHISNAKHDCFNVNDNIIWTPVIRQNACGVNNVASFRKSYNLDRIMGGSETELGEFPWMARLFYKVGNYKSFFCGGFLIHEKFVLTAGHCCKNRIGFEKMSVRLGEYDTLSEHDCYKGHCAPSHVDIDVEQIYLHENYNPNDYTNDICLLKLKEDATLSDYIYPICLPVDCNMQAYNYVNKTLTAAGWGHRGDEMFVRTVDPLQKVDLEIVPLVICKNRWKQDKVIIGMKHLCAGVKPGQDACHGDSGGPLMYESNITGQPRQYVAGLVSFGQPCSIDQKSLNPGARILRHLYKTNVAKFLPWIFNHMSELYEKCFPYEKKY